MSVVVRLGPHNRWAEKALVQAQEELDDPMVGRALLSVWSDAAEPEPTDDSGVERACDASKLGYRWIRVASVEELERAGFQLEPDPGDAYHYNIDIFEVSPQSVDSFFALFRDEQENPTWPKHRRRS